MTKGRVVETNQGIQDRQTVSQFDMFARQIRDKGWNGVEAMLAAGIGPGQLLEIGPGPGYVGLELAKKLGLSSFTGCEISPAMIQIARRNALEYGIRAHYVEGNAMSMPFSDERFDSVISNGSLHEWENPVQVFDEIFRVLRPGGHFCVTDLRRDAAAWKRWFVYWTTRPKAMRPGLVSSLNAAYTVRELEAVLSASRLCGAQIKADFFGLCVSGTK